MFTAKPFFKETSKSKTVELSLTYEDTELCMILALKQLQSSIGRHVCMKTFTLGKVSKIYDLYEKYPRLLFILKNKIHTLQCEIEYEDFNVDRRADVPDDVVYEGISLRRIRGESESQ